MSGVMSELQKPNDMRVWVDLCLAHLQSIPDLVTRIDFDSYEFLVQLAIELSDSRIYTHVHDELPDRLYATFVGLIPLYAEEYLQCPSQHSQIDLVYTNFAKLRVLEPLMPLPARGEERSNRYPTDNLLEPYFENLDRVKE